MLELVATDLVSPGFGESWGHTRTYGNRLFQNGALSSSDEVNGRNWFISTTPYLAEVNSDSQGGSGSQEGTIAVMGNVNATLWFDSADSDSGEYVNRFRGPETLEHDEAAHVLRLSSEDGSVTEFHDFDQTNYPQGLFKRQISPGGQVTEVVSYSGGEIAEVHRSASVNGTTVTESLTYSHVWFGRLSELILRRREGSGAWTNLRRVVFTYWSTYPNYWHWNEPDRGSGGDLRSAETFEWDNSVWKHTGTTYYTYYTQGEANGFVFGLKHVLGPDAVARMVADGQAVFGDFPNTYYGYYGENYARSTLRVSTTADLAAYADNTFEYDAQRRVTRETVQGGTLSYQYAYTTSSHPEDAANWKTKTTETNPDGTELQVFANAAGETLLSVHRTAAGDWIEYAEYNGGHRTLKASPAAVGSYDELQADLGVVLKAHEGLIELFEYSGPADPVPSKLMAEKIQQGSAGTPVTLREYEYTSHTAQGTTVYPVSKVTVYKDDNGTGDIETAYAYIWHTGTNRIQQQTVTLPAVPVSQNGSGATTSRTQQFDLYGNLLWSRDERGVITKQEVDPALGVVTRRIEDVDTAIEIDAPAGWATLPGFGLNLVIDFQYDEFGRVQRELGPEHTIDIEGVATLIRRARWTAYLEDAFGNELRQGQGYLKLADFSQTLINPVVIHKRTRQGHLLEEFQALQGWHSGSSGSSSVSLLEEVPVSVPGPVSPDEDAFPQESYVRWTTHQYANCCQLVSSRRYHLIPASGAGTSGANYDQTSFDHDIIGRRNRVQSPGGTITFTVYDARGQAVETWIGTNDEGATEADPSGGGFEPDNNMVLLSENQYDGGSAGGDGNLTKATQHVDETTARVTQYLYDWRNRQTATDGELDFYEQHVYDNLERVVMTERREGSASGQLLSRDETLYDNRGRVYRTIRHGVDPDTGNVTGQQTQDRVYDASDNLLRQEPASAMEYQLFEYDSLGRRVAEIDPLEHTRLFHYDAAGNMVSLIDQNEEVWTRDYDPLGRLVRSTNPLDESMTYGYSNAGEQTTVTNALSETTTSTFDAAGRRVSVSDPLGKITTYSFDSNGNEISVTDPNNLTTTSQYDYLNRLVQVTDPLGHSVQYAYNLAGELVTETDAKNQQTKHAYDALGRRISTTDRLNQITTFAFNSLGLQASLTDAENQTTSYVYDAYQRLSQTIWPNHVPGSNPGDSGYGIMQTEYDHLNRVLRTTDQVGDTVTQTHDTAGRLLARDFRTRANSPSGTIADSDSFTYDATSNLLTAVSSRYSNTVTLTYDAAGRKSSESLTISGQTYTSTTQYDAAGRVSTQIYPDGSEVLRGYTARGQLVTVAVNSVTVDTRLYDDGGRMTSSSYNNGVSETRTYNDDNTLASISFSGAAIGDLGYTWDANKNKTSESIGGIMSGYGFSASYDAEDRLIGWDRSDTNFDQSWNLSPVGDWNSITENTAVQNRTHGPVHELLTAAGQAVQHDPKGNMTQIPPALRPGSDPLKLKWDFDNKLQSADTDNDGIDDIFYRWDALGRRVGRDDGTTQTIYFQDGQQTLADYPAGGAAGSPSYTYVYGSYIDEVVMRSGGSGVRYYHRNQQYSITALTDGGGSVVERYAYTAYGELTILDPSLSSLTSSSSNNRYTYTGREWDAGLALYHYRARMYDAVAGRFVSRDPLTYQGSLRNLFLFLDGNALTLVDPTGESPQLPGPVPPGAVANANTPCGLLYSWMLPDPSNIPSLSENVEKYLKCILERIGQGATKPQARSACASQLGGESVTEYRDRTLRWLVSSYCCQERQERGKTKDPCEYGTQEGEPLGKPRRCWPPSDRSVDWPAECFECCNFLSCTENLTAILSSTGISGIFRRLKSDKEFDFVECQEACGVAGNTAR